MAGLGAAEMSTPLKVSEVAKSLNVSERTVRLWVTRGLRGQKLKAFRPGNSGNWQIREEDVQDFLTSNED